MTVLVAGPEHHLGLGRRRVTTVAERRAPTVVEVEHDDVRAAAAARPATMALGLVLLTDHVEAVLAQDRAHADRHDRPEVPEQDPARGRAPRGQASRTAAAAAEEPIGQPAMPIRSFRAARGLAPARLPSRSRGRRARPGPRSRPRASPPSAVRATTRCVPGRMRSKRKRPSRVGGRPQPRRPGSATQASATGSPSASRDRAADAVQLGHRARAGRRTAACGSSASGPRARARTSRRTRPRCCTT